MNRFEPLIKELEQADRLLKDHSEEIKRLKIELEYKQQAENQIRKIRAAVLNNTFNPENALREVKRILGDPVQ
jgi:hypothetical protein